MGSTRAFRNEAGGHRFQRVPPNEKRGRVHTSTITVAILSIPTEREIVLREQDLEEFTCRGSGPGGQHRNMTDSAVTIRHIPTGISVRCENERSQLKNREQARSVLRARIAEGIREREANKRAADRKRQVGVGARGDKRRTIALQRDQVTDHVTGKTMRTKEYFRGEIDNLWDSE